MEKLLSDEFAGSLLALAKDKAEQYQTAKPFPHIYFDNFLPVEAADAALRDFPEPKQLKWREFESAYEKKLAFDKVERLPAATRDVLYFLNSRPMLEFLEILTGIQGVMPDPYFVGGGLHQIIPGGKLGVHADFNHHEKLNVDRRINVLVYMNKDWKEEYGGHFELWNRDMSAAEQKILPVFNRCAIFSTTDFSFHGHPTPLACPPDRTRKSIATYYYTNGRPEEEVSDAHSTIFRQRPGGVDQERAPSMFRKLVHAFSPPILTSAYKRLRS